MADTNTRRIWFFGSGTPRRILDAAREGKSELFATSVLMAELDDVLGREKFPDRLQEAKVTVEELVLGYAALATLIEPVPIAVVITSDPDDDAVLASALSAQADAIVSGDSHLLNLERSHDIPIMTVPNLLAQLDAAA